MSLSTHTAPVTQSICISKDIPVHEQRRARFLHPVEPVSTAALVPRQWFVLLTSPTLELQVKMIEDLAHRRSVEMNRPGFSRHLASSLRNAFQTLPVIADC